METLSIASLSPRTARFRTDGVVDDPEEIREGLDLANDGCLMVDGMGIRDPDAVEG